MTVQPIGYYEKRWGNKMTTSGLPDLHIVINGWSFEVEIKAPNGKASELQKHIIEQINKSGCRGVVLYEHGKNIPDDGYEHYMEYETFKKVIEMYASQL